MFSWILIIIISGQKPVSYAAFHDKESCEAVRDRIRVENGIKTFCLKGGKI